MSARARGASAVQVTGLPKPAARGGGPHRLGGKPPSRADSRPRSRGASSGSEADAVSCALDVGADGTVEHPTVDCATWTLALRNRGHDPREGDRHGHRRAHQRSHGDHHRRAPHRGPAHRLGGVRQTVMKAGLKLVQDKPALLRVTVLANEAAMRRWWRSRRRRAPRCSARSASPGLPSSRRRRRRPISRSPSAS